MDRGGESVVLDVTESEPDVDDDVEGVRGGAVGAGNTRLVALFEAPVEVHTLTARAGMSPLPRGR